MSSDPNILAKLRDLAKQVDHQMWVPVDTREAIQILAMIDRQPVPPDPEPDHDDVPF